MENKIEKWLSKKIKEEEPVNPLIVTARHDLNQLNQLTKKEVVAYARQHGIAINSRKKKHELIDIILRT